MTPETIANLRTLCASIADRTGPDGHPDVLTLLAAMSDTLGALEIAQRELTEARAEVERLASGETCEIGQPASCGDYHNAGQCVRTERRALAEVRRLHGRPRTDRHGSGCVQCGIVWPCPTYRVVAERWAVPA